MGQPPVPDSGDDVPLVVGADPMDDRTWAALCAARADEQPPAELDDEEDGGQLDNGDDGVLSWAAGLADGGPMDTALPSARLAVMLEAAAGIDGRYAGAGDDEAAGAVAAWDRMMAYCAGRRFEALAALIRHRPAPGRGPEVPGGLPGVWDEFTGTEVALVLHESRGEGETLVDTAYELAGKLPGTMAALLAGQITEYKARMVQRATAHLNEAEAQAVEDLVLDRAGLLTPAGLRAALARAVMLVAPEKARARREAARRTRRVELRAEESGNSQIAARELDAEIAAAIDAELRERALELKQSGVGEDMQDRRVLALLERFGLAGDLPPSPRPRALTPAGPAEPVPAGTSPAGVTVPGRLNLTVPLATLADLADRPGELSGTGPVDPWQARQLGQAALRSRASKICVTITDNQGVMTGHGCARPPTRAERKALSGHGPPGDGGHGPGLTRFPGQDAKQLNSGNGLWVLDPGNGHDVLIVRICPVTTDPCDHRLYTPAHDPGKELSTRTGASTGGHQPDGSPPPNRNGSRSRHARRCGAKTSPSSPPWSPTAACAHASASCSAGARC